MKSTVKIPKSRLTAPIDYGEVLKTCRALGVALAYEEYDFIQTDGNVVVFDAYSAAHYYSPLDVKGGVIAFPFRLSCNTDSGERVAYCGLRFSESRIATWKPIINDSAKARLAVDVDAGAIPISSGVCCISSEAAYNEYRSHLKDEEQPLSGHIMLDGQINSEVELFGYKYAVFSTGWGDGRYKCYAGYTEDGTVAAIMVDFGMIEYRIPESDETIEVEIEGSGVYIADPNKSEPQNNIERWTREIEAATTKEGKFTAYARRGYAYHSQGETEKALADYMKAIETCAGISDRGTLLRAWPVYDNAADIYIRKSDYEAAIAIMTVALRVGDHFYAGAFVRLIDLYLLTKHNDKAMEIAELMLKNRPNDPVANMKFAEVCVSEMKYAAAATAYERLASEFKLYDNLFDEASCLIELGDLDGADSALERYPSKEYNEQYWYYKAYIAFKKRNYADALESAERSHAIDEEYMPALYLIIDTLSIMQEYHSVAIYAEKYKKLRPDKEYGYSVCAEAHLILGNFSESAKNYWYLYKAINKSDKYAALAAITASRMGDNSRRNKLLKLLRRKRSRYYAAAAYAAHISKYRKRKLAIVKIVYNLNRDDDFLLQLAVYLAGTDNVRPATHILDVVFKGDNPSFEVVAQQVRIAAKLGDDELFDRLFDYYVEHFAGNVTDDDKRVISERFRSSVGAPIRRVNWDQIKPETQDEPDATAQNAAADGNGGRS
ncbi:MAG: DUF4241 domain-containing protein [Clostridiales bacterium]|nr:DUF4241 domain-containing protein [Clostridiales bacterium]